MSHSPDSLKRIPYRLLKNEIRRVSSAPGSSSTTSLPGLYTARDEQATTPQSPTTLPPRHARSGSDEHRQVARPGRTSSRLHNMMPSETTETYQQPEEGVSTKKRHTGGRASSRELLERTSSHPGSNSRRVSSIPVSRSTTSLSRLCTPFDDQEAAPPPTLPLHRTRSDSNEPVAPHGRAMSSRLHHAMTSAISETSQASVEEASTKDLYTGRRASHRDHSRERLCSATKLRASSISETCQVPSTKELHPGRRASHKEHSRERVCSATKSRVSSRERSQERLNSATKHHNSSGSLYFADLVRRRQIQLAATSSAKNGADMCPRRSSELYTIRHGLTDSDSGLEMIESKNLVGSLIQSPSQFLTIFMSLSGLVIAVIAATVVVAHLL